MSQEAEALKESPAGTQPEPLLLRTPDAPYEHIALVTPSDTAKLTPTRGLSFTAAGTLKVDTVGGETVTLASGNLATATIHKLAVTRVYATGTSATGIVAYW